MKMTFKTALAAAAFSVLLPSPVIDAQRSPEPAQAEESERNRLQGTWEGFVDAGLEIRGDCTLTVAGDSLHFRGPNNEEWYRATFDLPADSEPKELRATVTGCSAPDFVGLVFFAIYKFVDGRLVLTSHAAGEQAAPKTFKGDATSRTFVLKKAKAGKPQSVIVPYRPSGTLQRQGPNGIDVNLSKKKIADLKISPAPAFIGKVSFAI